MESHKTITFTWQELFDKVWSAPLLKVAEEIGISDTALRKTCWQVDIPLPKQGHWAREAGRREEPPEVITPETPRRNISFTVLDPAFRKKREVTEPQPAPLIDVPERLVRPHRLVSKTMALAKNAIVDRGRLHLNFSNALKLKVSPAGLSRACRIVNTLIKESGAIGCSWEVTEKGQTIITLNGEEMKFELIEKVVKRDKPKPPEPRRRSRLLKWEPNLAGPESYYGYEWAPTNEMTIKIDEYLDIPTRRTWADSSNATLESKLGDFVARLPVIAEAVKARRERWEAQLRELELEREREKQAKRYAEGQRMLRARLVDNMERWEQADRLRAFCDAVESSAYAADAASKAEWLAWAREQADLLDPMRGDASALFSLDVNVPEWFKGSGLYERPTPDWWSPAD